MWFALLEKCPDVNVKNEEGETPLMAAIHENKKVCPHFILIHENVDVKAVNKYGKNALHYAVWNGNGIMCAALLNKSVDINKTNDRGETPLMCAIKWEENKCAKIILRKCRNFESEELKYVWREGNTEMRKILRIVIEKGLLSEKKKQSLQNIRSYVAEWKYILRRSKYTETVREFIGIAEEKGLEEAVRFFLKEKQSLQNIRGYVAGKGERNPKCLQNIKI